MNKHTHLVLVILLFTMGIRAQNIKESEKTSVTNKEVYMPNEKESLTESAIKQNFYQNAKQAGLNEEKTKELLKIIDERNQVLKDLDAKKKQAYAPFSIQDPGTLYNFKINEARNYYAKKINGSLTYKQYCYFAMSDYKVETKEKVDLEYTRLVNGNPNLTKDQQTKLYSLIYDYHLNHYLTTAYYSFDKTIQKPKLGMLRFNFEKEFAKFCKEYNIKISEINTTKNNGFEWN